MTVTLTEQKQRLKLVALLVYLSDGLQYAIGDDEPSTVVYYRRREDGSGWWLEGRST